MSKIDKDDKNNEIINKIKEIFINNKERYGYRRVTLELRNQGYEVNHKKVYRLMIKLGLKPLKRNKRKYTGTNRTGCQPVQKILQNSTNKLGASRTGKYAKRCNSQKKRGLLKSLRFII